MNKSAEWVALPKPASNLNQYNSLLSSSNIEEITEASKIPIIRKLFEEKENWESLLKAPSGHRQAIKVATEGNEYINSVTKCKWIDADLSILVSLDSSGHSANISKLTTQKIQTGTSASVIGIPFESTISIPSKISNYSSPTGSSNPSQQDDDKLTITIQRLLAGALGWTEEEMERKGLIKREAVYNECGEQISSAWPFFSGETALSEYGGSGPKDAIGIPLQGLMGTAAGQTDFDNREAWWHTNFDPDGTRGYRTEKDPVEKEKDYKFDGNIFLSVNADPHPRIRANAQAAGRTGGNFPVTSAQMLPSNSFSWLNPTLITPPRAWMSGLHGNSNRQDISKQLICYPGISNDSLNSYPYKPPTATITPALPDKSASTSISSITIAGFQDLGYKACGAATSSSIEDCQDEPLCCRLAVDVLPGQTTLETKIIPIGRRKVYTGGTAIGPDDPPYVANVFYVDRRSPQELLILDTLNLDGLYSGPYTYSLVSSVGVSAALFGWTGRTISPSSTRIVDPRNIAYGAFGYARGLQEINSINYKQRYLYINGRGSGIVQVRVKDQMGCEELITIVVSPSKFGPCDFISLGVQPLTVTFESFEGIGQWPNILVTSPAGTASGAYNGPNAPPTGQLGWAWDRSRPGINFTRPGRLGAFIGPGEGGGRGTFDINKLALKISITGGAGGYTFGNLNDSVYVARRPSNWDGQGRPPEDFWAPHPSSESPPPNVPNAPQFGFKMGFDIGSNRPYYESSYEMPAGNYDYELSDGTTMELPFRAWGNEVVLYANKPGDRCFFRVFDSNGCSQTIELRLPCSTEVTHPTANTDQLYFNRGRTRIDEIYQGYDEYNGMGLHLHLGLGEEESASLADILRYTSAPTTGYHKDPFQSLPDPVYKQDFRRIDNYWHLTCSSLIQDEFEEAGSAMYRFNPNTATWETGQFRIPGLTHEIFTDKPIKPKLTGESFHRDFTSLMFDQNANELANGKPSNYTRAVQFGRNGDEFKFKGVNLGIATFNYSVDDGMGGCDMQIFVYVTPPEIIYGDFIQGHSIHDRPWSDGAPDVAEIEDGAYRIEELFAPYEYLLMNGFPALYGDGVYPWNNDGLVGESTPIRDPGIMQSANRGNEAPTNCPPDCPGVSVDGTYRVPLGISMPCGKGFFGIKIASHRMNYHQACVVYQMHVDGNYLPTEHIGWYAGRDPGGALMPYIPTEEQRKSMGTGWKIEIEANSQAANATWKKQRTIFGAGAWGNKAEMYPFSTGGQLPAPRPISTWNKKQDSDFELLDANGQPNDDVQGGWSHSNVGNSNEQLVNNSGHDNWINGGKTLAKHYDLVVGPLRMEDFSDVTGDIGQPANEYDRNALRLKISWAPFAESWQPLDSLNDDQLAGYGWRWPSEYFGEATLPIIKATPELFFDMASDNEDTHYTNPEFKCAFFVAAADPNEFLGMTKEIEERLFEPDSLDSNCNEPPIDNILIANPTQSLANKIGTWVRITWEPGYNDNTLLPREIPPDPHLSLQDWRTNDPEGYKEAVDNELTKCYKIMRIPNSDKFEQLRQTRQTSDGQTGFHKRTIAKVEYKKEEITLADGSTEVVYDGYSTCEKCAQEVVIKSCDGSEEYIVRYPLHFKHLPEDSVIFDQQYVWKLNYRFLSDDPPQQVDNSAAKCFSFHKENPYALVNSDEHGNATGDAPPEEVEIQNFNVSKNDKTTYNIESKQFLEDLVNRSVSICDSIGVDEELCTEGTTCDECFEKIEPYDPPYAPDPGGPYPPSGPSPSDPPAPPAPPPPPPPNQTISKPEVILPHGPGFELDIKDITPADAAPEDGKIKIEIKCEDCQPEEQKAVAESLGFSDLKTMYSLEVTGPGISYEMPDDGVPENEPVYIDVDWTAFEGAVPRDPQGIVEAEFWGIIGCKKYIKFDYQCETFLTSPELKDCEGCELLYQSAAWPGYLPGHPLYIVYQSAWLRIQDSNNSKVTVYDEDFFIITEQNVDKDDYYLRIEDGQTSRKDYRWGPDLTAYSKESAGERKPTRAAYKQTNPTKKFNQDNVFSHDEDVENPVKSSLELPNPLPNPNIFDGYQSGEELSGRGYYIHLVSKEMGKGSREEKIYYFYRLFDGMICFSSEIQSIESYEIGSDQKLHLSDGNILWSSTEDSSQSRASSREKYIPEKIKNTIKSIPINEKTEKLTNALLKERRQIKTNDKISVFAHSTSGNQSNSSPDQNLMEADNQTIVNFLNAAQTRETQSVNDLSQPFNLSTSNYAWTSAFAELAQNNSIEKINESIYDLFELEDLTLENLQSGSVFKADKNIYLRNSSSRTYIIEASTNPSGLSDFKLCGEEGSLAIKTEALSFQSRSEHNASSSSSKFFIVKANDLTTITFEQEDLLNDDALNLKEDKADKSTAFFFRVVGGFYFNQEDDNNTFLTTFDAGFTLNDFNVYALLPKDEYTNFSVAQGTNPRGTVAIETEDIKDVQWNGQNYILVNIFKGLSSSAELNALSITKQ